MSKVFTQFHQEHSSSRPTAVISEGVYLVACQADGTVSLENDLSEYSHSLCIFKIMISLSPSGIFLLFMLEHTGKDITYNRALARKFPLALMRWGHPDISYTIPSYIQMWELQKTTVS